MHGNERLQEETYKLSKLFLVELNVCMEDIAQVEDIFQADIFSYDFHIVNGSMIGELARKSVGKHSNSVGLLRYISRINYVSKINALFEAYRFHRIKISSIELVI